MTVLIYDSSYRGRDKDKPLLWELTGAEEVMMYGSLYVFVIRLLKKETTDAMGYLLTDGIDALDRELFKMYGMELIEEPLGSSLFTQFNDKIRSGEIDITWIKSPHAYAILKAKAVATGTFNKGADFSRAAQAIKG